MESARIMEQEYSQGGTYIQGAPITQRREHLGDSSDDNRSHRGWRHPERGRYPNWNGRPPDRGRYPDRDLLEEEDILDEDPLMVEDPLMLEDPLMEMEDPWTPWWTRTTRSSRTSQISETCYSTDTPYNTGYLCFGGYF